MSLYRTILEEEMEVPILDDENSPEIKEIEDVVADQDANAFEQDEAQEAEFGTGMGGPGPEDALDEMCMAIAECQMADNEILMSIGIMEAGKLGRTGAVIYEAADIKGFFKKIKDWIVKFFKKVWQVLQRYFQNISATFRTNKSFLQKFGSQISNGYKIYQKDNTGNLKGYTFAGLQNNDPVDASSMKELDKTFSKNASELKAADGKGMTEQTADEVDTYIKNMRAAMVRANSGIEAGEFREKCMNFFRNGKADDDSGKEEMLMSDSDIKAWLDPKAKKAVEKSKKALDKAKTECKNEIKKINTLEKSLSNKTYKGNDTAESTGDSTKLKVVQNYKTVMQALLSATQIYRAAFLTSCRQAMIQARIYGNAYVYAANKKNPKYKGFQDESASYGFLSGSVSLV